MADDNYMYVTGRLVQGSAFDPQTKNMNGGPLMDLKGNPKIQYFMGVAVDKTDQAMLVEWGKIQQAAQAGFPGGEWELPTFAWKVIDGDQAPNNTKPGFAGNFVFRFTSGFKFPVYNQGAQAQIVDPEQVKRGYYVRMVFTCKPNGNLQKPGMYLNIVMVELVGYGEEIASGPDVSVLHNAPAVALPVGASTTPVAAGPPVAVPGTAGGPPAPPGAAAPPAGGGPGYQVGAAPDFLNPGATVPPPPAAAGPVMTAKAAGQTFEAFQAQGWTQEQLIAQGYMQ